MVGEPDAGNPHVRFDEGTQETYNSVARLRPTLQFWSPRKLLGRAAWHERDHTAHIRELRAARGTWALPVRSWTVTITQAASSVRGMPSRATFS